MSEPVKNIPTEVYLKEARYMESLARHSVDFDKLIHLVPVGQERVKEAMLSCYNVEPNRLLDRDKLKKLKDTDEELWNQVNRYYKDFLTDKLGLN